MSNKISVVINVYNEEKVLRECLEAVKDFDEIVICDMYSTDSTLDIAKEYNCKIVMHERTGYVEPARNFANSQASNDWILVVDADEIITKELRDYLYKLIENPHDITAVKIPRLNYYWGKPMEMYYPDHIIRFMKKDVIDWPAHVHSSPIVKEGQIHTIDKNKRELAIIHKSIDSFASEINTLNKYSTLEAERIKGSNKKINIPYAAWKGLWTVFEKFVLKGGYKDGTRGFIMCVRMGFYKFSTQVKYWEYLLEEENKSLKNIKEDSSNTAPYKTPCN